MDCRKFSSNLEDYLQGGLDFPGRFGMERHAQQCLDCGKQVADAQKLSQMAREMSRVKTPPNFEATLQARILRTKAKRSRLFWRYWEYGCEWLTWRSALAGAAAVAVLFAAGFIGWRLRHDDGAVAQREVAAPGGAGGSPLAAAPVERPSPAVAQPITARKLMRPLVVPPAGMDLADEAEFAPAIRVEPADSGFVEYLVPGPGDRQLIMRFPKAVRMQYDPPSEEYFIRNVSH